MQIAPGWHLFYQGSETSGSVYEAALIGPQGQKHTMTTDSYDSLHQMLVAKLDELGVRIRWPKRDDLLTKLTLDPFIQEGIYG